MAERRMFSTRVVSTDRFNHLSDKAQLLYFHLGMLADDDGFIESAELVLERKGMTQSVLNELIEAKLVYLFSSGVIVIRHWKAQNTIRANLYKPTFCQDELAMLEEHISGVYTLKS